uniref:Eukaryotic translation initiation factor 5B n=1 Tax=Oryza nivara TaxID=4536 RepID=A0A0E0FNM1_ORYNI
MPARGAFSKLTVLNFGGILAGRELSWTIFLLPEFDLSVDRLFGWKRCPNAPIKKALKQQAEGVKMEFDARLTDFKMQGINTILYYRNKEMDCTYKNIVPTCAISGEGIPDLLLLSMQWAQKKMKERLIFSNNIECTVLEVKVTEGHCTTIDVVLANGFLREGDQIVTCGMQGPIVTHIRALLTPHPMEELRIKCPYQHHKEIKASQGIKISAPPGDDQEKSVNKAMAEMVVLMNRIDKNNVIYHLFDQFTTYIEGLREIEKDEKIVEAVFPCVLKIIPDCVFNLKDPIVLGVDVLEGVAKVGTPLCLPSNGFACIGNIASIQNSSKQVDVARKGEKVAIKITGSTPDEQKKCFGRNFGIDDELVSFMTRKSIDLLKENHRGDLTLKEWELVRTLKHIFRGHRQGVPRVPPSRRDAGREDGVAEDGSTGAPAATTVIPGCAAARAVGAAGSKWRKKGTSGREAPYEEDSGRVRSAFGLDAVLSYTPQVVMVFTENDNKGREDGTHTQGHNLSLTWPPPKDDIRGDGHDEAGHRIARDAAAATGARSVDVAGRNPRKEKSGRAAPPDAVDLGKQDPSGVSSPALAPSCLSEDGNFHRENVEMQAERANGWRRKERKAAVEASEVEVKRPGNQKGHGLLDQSGDSVGNNHVLISSSNHERKKRPMYNSEAAKEKNRVQSSSNDRFHRLNNDKIKECSSAEKVPKLSDVNTKEKSEIDQLTKGAILANEDQYEWDDLFFDDGGSKFLTVENKCEVEGVEASDKNDMGTRGLAHPAKVEQARKDMGLRSPVCCFLGHSGTGKTKLLDCILRTNVPESEAGGITQQFGVTFFPMENIRERIKELKADAVLYIPGLLLIDTPGHETFRNFRCIGSRLCDIAILVVDVILGLQMQTLESLDLLKRHKIDFIIALNKVDNIDGWKQYPNASFEKALALQSESVRMGFEKRLSDIVSQLNAQGIVSGLYYINKDKDDKFKNIVPTSSIRAQKMNERLTIRDKIECTILDVKFIEGHGTTIDVVLSSGVLHLRDQIIMCGSQGPIKTHIRALLTPNKMKELQVKSPYQHHKEIKHNNICTGTCLYVVRPGDDQQDVVNNVLSDIATSSNWIDKSKEGIYVQASSLGSLKAITEFLKSPAMNIPVGTPLCIPSKGFIRIGKIASIQNSHKQVDVAREGEKVAIKIVGSNQDEANNSFGRTFGLDDELVSYITKESIDVLKEHHREIADEVMLSSLPEADDVLVPILHKLEDTQQAVATTVLYPSIIRNYIASEEFQFETQFCSFYIEKFYSVCEVRRGIER